MATSEINKNNNQSNSCNNNNNNNNNNNLRWFDVEGVPDAYTFPQQGRPGKSHIFTHRSKTFPVIDLAGERADAVKEIIQAAQDFGVFQVVNHGFPEKVIKEAVRVSKEFFRLPVEEKVSPANNKNGWVYVSSTDYAKDGVHLWRDNLKLPCHPLQSCMLSWPQNPTIYREVMADYVEEIERLSSRMMEMICEGLGLEGGYLKDRSEVQLVAANNYPPCPEPSKTLGLLGHKDSSFITILYQGTVPGLEVLDDATGDWFGVLPLPNALVINIGNQLEIVSNGKLRSPEHRVVTNPEKERTTIATFINPSPTCLVEPAKALVDDLKNPPRFQPVVFKDYVATKQAFGLRSEAFLNHVAD